MQTEQEQISKWKELREFFSDRRKKPLRHPEFIAYFLLIIIGFGGISIWASFFDAKFSHDNMNLNLAAYSVAIITAGSIELMFVKNNVIKLPLILIAIGVIFFSCIIFLTAYNFRSFKTYFFVIPTTLFSLYIWWIANAENSNLTTNYFIEQSQASKKFDETLDIYDENN